MGKKTGKRKEDKAVKIDSELAEKIDEFISKKENKLKFSSLKQFIDIAVFEKLEREVLFQENQKTPKQNQELIKTQELKREINSIIKKEARVPSGII